MSPVISCADSLVVDAISEASTWHAALRRLGLSDREEHREALQARCDLLGIDLSHLRRRRSWDTLDSVELQAAVRSSRTFNEACRKLDISPGGASTNRLMERLNTLGIDHSHLQHARQRRMAGGNGRTWTDDELRDAYDQSRSVADVLRRLGLVVRGDNYRTVKTRMTALGLDPHHLPGQAWARGASVVPLDEALQRGRKVSGPVLLARLIRAGLMERRCAGCLGDQWLGLEIPLELDHINGDHLDNRLENLRALCPNCHALTPTYRGRNIARRRSRLGTVDSG